MKDESRLTGLQCMYVNVFFALLYTDTNFQSVLGICAVIAAVLWELGEEGGRGGWIGRVDGGREG